MAVKKEVMKVGVSTPIEDVLESDKAGKMLDFSLDEFLYLDSEEIKSLSGKNKERYFVAKGLFEMENNPENGDVIDIVASPENARMFTTQRMQIETKGGLEHHYARPDKIDSYKAKGYKIASVNDLKGGGRENLQIKLGGYTDVALMVRPKDVAEKFRKKAAEYNAKIEGRDSVNEGRQAIEQAGGRVTLAESSITER